MRKINGLKFSAAVCTLGCRVNQYESDCVISEFINLGFEIKEFGDICDVYVINTCTVTAGSDKKSKQMIRRAKKLNPNAVIAVCGCLSQRNPEIFESHGSDLHADIIIGTSEKIRIPELCLEQLHVGTRYIVSDSGRHVWRPYKNNILVKPIGEYKIYENINAYQSENTRAYVKIQDGCDAKCSYCIIPQVRGTVKSRKYCDIYAEIKRFNDMDYHEIVLAGIEISSYGKDFEKENLINLLEKLNAEPELTNIKSIRLSSIDPSIIKKDFIDRLANLDKIANHFHLSLQSGSTRILNLMRRKYNAETVTENLFYAKDKIKDLNLTADIIVGFPGETEEDFEKSADIIKLLNIYHAHVFSYSKRPGTDAENLENQICENIKNQRSKKISQTCEKIKEEIHKNNSGREFEVIIEDLSRDDFYTAKTRNFLDVKIKKISDTDIRGTVRKIKVTGYDKDFLYGEII